MSAYRLFVLILVLAALIGIGFSAQQRSSDIAYSDSDAAYNRPYWEQQISAHGAARAYAEFVQTNAAAPRNRQHFSAHAMGAALYTKLGMSGIAVCDQTFAFGCYHGLASKAIAEGGEKAIQALDAECTHAFGKQEFNLMSMCQHGIGHGILEYVGYQDLGQALEMCTSLVDQPAPRVGCTSGVFMEYFTPLAVQGEGMEPALRPFDSATPYAPCPSVAAAFQQSCYFELGQALRQTPDSEYLSVCAGLSGVPRTNCFLGVGTDFARIPDPEQVVVRCEAAAPEDAFFCRAGAAWGYSGDGTQRSQEMCAYNDSAVHDTCERAADLTDGIESPFTATP